VAVKQPVDAVGALLLANLYREVPIQQVGDLTQMMLLVFRNSRR